MREKTGLKLTAFISAIICLISALNLNVSAVNYQPESTIENITIYKQSGVIEGETIQLKATVESSSSMFDSVEWSSSNPQVISCTEDGKIKGLIAGKSATITCKAKWGSEKISLTVYCVEKLSEKVKCNLKDDITLIHNRPGFDPKDICINLPQILKPLILAFSILKSTTSINAYFSNKVQVCGRIGNYAYIRYGDSYEKDGFVRYSELSKTIDGFLDISAADMNVWGNGVVNETKKLTTTYNGDVEWVVSNDDYVDFDETTGQVVGKVPGKTVTITAKADGMTAKCTVHLLYKWPQSWTTVTNKATSLYKAVGSTYKENRSLPAGTGFVVGGDDGTDSGWAFGKIEGTDTWGYVRIEDISTKGTISQYNSLGWTWPVDAIKNGESQSVKAKFISSPYGWRDDDPIKHKGMDITNGISSKVDFANSVDGYEVVSAFAGKVIFVHDNSEYKRSCGNCVAIRSNKKDPVTGKYYVAIYMHLKSKPIVNENQNVSTKELLGYVGNTGNSGGSHLHFEVNNQNLSYGQTIYYEDGSGKEMVFGSVINPLYFYMDYYYLDDDDPEKININPTCSAMNYRKPFWYGDDIKETKEP